MVHSSREIARGCRDKKMAWKMGQGYVAKPGTCWFFKTEKLKLFQFQGTHWPQAEELIFLEI